MNLCPLGTMREACARAVEWMGRGHVAHEHSFLLTLVPKLREMDISTSPAEQQQAAIVMLHRMKRRRPAEEARLIQLSILRIIDETSCRLDDPMEIYTDRDKWWPHSVQKETRDA